MEPQQPLVCPSRKMHYVLAFATGALVAGGALYAYGYQKGFAEARNRVTESPLGGIFRPTQVLQTFSGVVESVDGNSITVKMHQVGPFDDPDLAVRIASVSADTKITKRTMGDISAYMKAMDEYSSGVQSAKKRTAPPSLPEPTISTIKLSDIKAGDTVVVSAVDNIATKKTFAASEIQVQ